jgi:hypothetical protein
MPEKQFFQEKARVSGNLKAAFSRDMARLFD